MCLDSLEEMLVDIVLQIPPLWDKRDPMYYRNDRNNIHWKDIGNEIGCLGEN